MRYIWSDSSLSRLAVNARYLPSGLQAGGPPDTPPVVSALASPPCDGISHSSERPSSVSRS